MATCAFPKGRCDRHTAPYFPTKVLPAGARGDAAARGAFPGRRSPRRCATPPPEQGPAAPEAPRHGAKRACDFGGYRCGYARRREDDELTEYEASPAASMAKGLRSKYKKRLRTVKRGVVKKEMAQPATRVGAREVKKEGKLAEALSGHIAPSKLPRAHCARTPRAR